MANENIASTVANMPPHVPFADWGVLTRGRRGGGARGGGQGQAFWWGPGLPPEEAERVGTILKAAEEYRRLSQQPSSYALNVPAPGTVEDSKVWHGFVGGMMAEGTQMLCLPQCTALDEVIPSVQHRHLRHTVAPVLSRKEAETHLRGFLERHFPDLPYTAVIVPEEVWILLQKGLPPAQLEAHLHTWTPQGGVTPLPPKPSLRSPQTTRWPCPPRQPRRLPVHWVPILNHNGGFAMPLHLQDTNPDEEWAMLACDLPMDEGPLDPDDPLFDPPPFFEDTGESDPLYEPATIVKKPDYAPVEDMEDDTEER
jgi:hypothetical protein